MSERGTVSTRDTARTLTGNEEADGLRRLAGRCRALQRARATGRGFKEEGRVYTQKGL